MGRNHFVAKNSLSFLFVTKKMERNFRLEDQKTEKDQVNHYSILEFLSQLVVESNIEITDNSFTNFANFYSFMYLKQRIGFEAVRHHKTRILLELDLWVESDIVTLN